MTAEQAKQARAFISLTKELEGLRGEEARLRSQVAHVETSLKAAEAELKKMVGPSMHRRLLAVDCLEIVHKPGEGTVVVEVTLQDVRVVTVERQ